MSDIENPQPTHLIDDTAPYAGFGGEIGTTVARSQPDWPDRPTAPTGAPNIVVIMADDMGYSDLGCYGSEIPTPHIDKLADEGVRYTHFHVNPMCSPTRASLLTGLNAHDAGMGFVAEADPGFPGYAMELTRNCATMAEVLRDNGYSTFMSGKWHLCRVQDKNPAGDKNSWPVQRGFDEFYGILNGFTNFWHPDRLINGNSVLNIDQYPDDYYLTDDLTDRAIEMIRNTKTANPEKPFFLYMAHPAVHAPLHAKDDDIARHAGNYDHGWDALREERFARQKRLGILPEAALPPRNYEEGQAVEAWSDLTDTQRAVYARYMEVYAAMVDSVDQSTGRLLAAIDQLGELDNTIILFTSDNGASREGEEQGSTQYFQVLPPRMAYDVERDHDVLDLIGGPRTLPHYPRGWAMACNTPLRLYKKATHAGGHQVPMIMRWPEHIGDAGGLRDQYTHITDVMPTLLDLIGIERPEIRNGRVMKPLAGESFAATLTDPAAPTAHTEQYYELAGSRGLYRDGWEAVTDHLPQTNFSDERWELFNIAADPSQANDLSAEHPDKLAELQAAWEDAADRYQVKPLDEGSWLMMSQRPASDEVFRQPLTVYPGTPSLEHWRAGSLVMMRAWTTIVSLDYQLGDEGVLVAHGDQGGGYSLWIEDGELVFCSNDFGTMRTVAGGPVPVGTQEIRLEAFNSGAWEFGVRVLVDGVETGSADGFGCFAGIAPFQGIDVGIDRRSPVSWDLHERRGTFAYTGTLHSARWEPGEPNQPLHGADLVDFLRKIGEKFD